MKLTKFWKSFRKNLFIARPEPYFSVTGVVVAVFFYGESLAPSLIPRNTLNQAILSSIAIFIFYNIGSLLGIALGKLPRLKTFRFSRKTYILYIVTLLGYVGFVTVQRMNWQEQQRISIGLAPQEAPDPLVVMFASLVSLVVISIFLRIVIRLVRLTKNTLPRSLGKMRAVIAPFVVGGGFVVVLVCGFIATRSLLRQATVSLSPDVVFTESELVSGSASSSVDWLLLSKPGREFVGNVTTADKISQQTGATAKQPIRLYVGLLNANSLEGQISLLLDEINRTKALQRSTIILYTPSGTGYVNPAAVEAAEILLDGDVVSIAVQYGLVSSFVQFIDDKQAAVESTKAVLEAIQAERKQMKNPPKLFLYGESLGSLGSQGALPSSNVSEIAQAIDGALWVGSPSASGLWKELLPQTSGEILEPVYQSGQTVRFASDVIDLGQDYGQWGETKIAFLYNPTDPVVWISPKLIYSEPDWLNDEQAQGVYKHMRWRPLVTFGHVSFELVKSIEMPSGFGHNYEKEVGLAWAYILGKPDAAGLFNNAN